MLTPWSVTGSYNNTLTWLLPCTIIWQALHTTILYIWITIWRVISWGANFRCFRGWLGSHEILPPTKINAYGDMAMWVQMMGVAINIVASNCYSSHCHPGDSVFNTNILLLSISNKEDRERDRVCVSITASLVQYHAPRLVAVTKLILRALSDFPRKLPAIRYVQK